MVSFFDFSHFVLLPAALPRHFRSQAALGSGFSLQAAFWYQNAMLALFLRSKKSQRRSSILILFGSFFDFHFLQAMRSNISEPSNSVVAT